MLKDYSSYQSAQTSNFQKPGGSPGKTLHCNCRKGKPLESSVSYVAQLAQNEGSSKKDSLRKKIYNLRNKIGEVYSRVYPCGRWFQAGRENESFISAVRGKSGKSYYKGLQSCNSVWTCPICSLKISEKRREELVQIIDNAIKSDLQIVFVTLTRPHTAKDKCKELRDSIAHTYRKMTNTRDWDWLMESYQIEGWIKDLECTIGLNGFHPHVHCLFFLPNNFNPDEFGEEIVEQWVYQMNGEGVKVSRSAQDYRKANRKNCKAVAEYLSKWDMAAELTQGNKKVGKKGKTAFQVFDAYLESKEQDEKGKGDKKLLNQFLEYAKAFEGARQLTFSKGLKKKYLKMTEMTDEEICKDEKAEKTLFGLEKPIFYALKNKSLEADALSEFDRSGSEKLLSYLKKAISEKLKELKCTIEIEVHKDTYYFYTTKLSSSQAYGSVLSGITSKEFDDVKFNSS